MSTKLRPPVKIHGGKFYLSSWIIGYFPKKYREMDYVEPFVGGGSVFLSKERPVEGFEETINDIDPGIAAILWALRDEPNHFIGRLKRTKYTEGTFDRAIRKSASKIEDHMDHAVNEIILRRMSRGGLKKAFAWSNRMRGGQPGDVNAWDTIIEELPKIAERLQGVFVFNKPALEVVYAYNNENTLLYCDPPYLPDTRTAQDAYEYEMSTDDHIDLANILLNFKGKVIISGYQSTLYKRLYKPWKCVQKKVANHASQSKTKAQKVECLWMNY